MNGKVKGMCTLDTNMPQAHHILHHLARLHSAMRTPTMAPWVPGAGSPRSEATRSATEMAAMRRGCVQIRLARAPRPASMAASSRNWGTCGQNSGPWQQHVVVLL